MGRDLRAGAWLMAGAIGLAVHAVQWLVTEDAGVGGVSYLVYHAAALAGLSLVGAGLMWVGRPLGRWRWVALWAGLVGLGAFTLGPDLENLSIRLGGDHAPVALWCLIAAVAAGPPLALLVGGWLVARGAVWRWLVGLGAVAALAADEFVLEQAYEGGHLYLFLTAFPLLFLALPEPPVLQGRGRWLAPVAVGLVLFGFLVPPGNAARLATGAMDSASVARLLLPLQVRDSAEVASASPERHAVEPVPGLPVEWFEAPLVPPTVHAPHAESGIVILITVDALRADLLYTPSRTRWVGEYRQLARKGTWFRQVFSPSTGTRFALGAMMTGHEVTRLSWRRDSYSQAALEDGNPPLLTERLQAAGIKTIVGVPNPYMFLKESGFVRGLDEVRRFKPPKGQRYALVTPVIDWMLERLGTVSPGERAFFYTHLLDPHAPYNSVTKKGNTIQRYLAEVQAVGQQLKRLHEGIVELGLERRVTLIITADHGESFGRHGQRFHNNVAYEHSVKVPLIVVGPGIKQQEIQPAVSLVDLAPTILELFGLPVPPDMDGRSLAATLAGGARPVQRPLFSANYKAGAVLFPDRHKLILRHALKTTELFHLQADRHEKYNLCLSKPEKCAMYRKAGQVLLRGHWPGVRPAAE